MQTDVDRPRVVVALFRDRVAAENAIRALQDAGFPRDAIGVAVRDRTAQGRLAAETDSKAAEGAATGALSGGALGGLVGLLVGIGALAIPGLGPVIAGGALASTLGVAGGTAVAGAGIGAATGGILGALVGMGIPDEEARHFDRGFREGGTLVTLEAAGREMEAREILGRFGGDLGSVTVGRDADAVAAGAFPDATIEERAVWGGGDRRDPVHRGRRRSDR